MPTAVVSDIHGNADAFTAVLADIDARGIKDVVCLGDIVGYGPEPGRCVDMVMERCRWSLVGNHDFAAMYEPVRFNAVAATAAYWTSDALAAEPDNETRHRREAFMRRLRVRVCEPVCGVAGGFPVLAVHGSPRKPITEYIFPDDAAASPEKLRSVFGRVDHLVIVGHTHVPGVFTDEPDFYAPDEFGDTGYAFSADEKAIVNVGSVGQPRDLDPRASYAVLFEDRVEFVRVAYDPRGTAAKIRAVPELDDWLADRLLEGR